MSGINVSARFDALVKDLDESALEALKQSLETEIGARAEDLSSSSIHIDTIRPGMSASDKEQVAQEIARVLRERG